MPLIVYVPPKLRHLCPQYQPGGTVSHLASFEDFAPTVLNLAGIKVPDAMQGRAFLGKQAEVVKNYQFGFRTNQGPHYDPIRTVRDERFKYIRNYIPHKPLMLRQGYQWGMVANQAYDLGYKQGHLEQRFRKFFEAKPTEELYDLEADPFEMNNLASQPDYREKLVELRNQVGQRMRQTKDLGFFPPYGRDANLQPLYDWVRASKFPLPELFALAEMASSGDVKHIPELEKHLASEHSAMRYWAASGLANIASRGNGIEASPALRQLINDPDPDVAGMAAGALCYMGDAKTGLKKLVTMMAQDGWQEAASNLHAYIMLHHKTNEIQPHLPALRTLAKKKKVSVWSPVFYARSILVDVGVNSPTELFDHEAWQK